MKKLFILLLYSLLISLSYADNTSWEVFSTYSTYSQLEEHNGLLYIRSDNAVFYIKPEEASAASITQIEGLSSTSVQFIIKCEEINSLVFVHSDATIDILSSDNKINSIFELKNKTIVGSKKINHATICGKSLFLACDFGFVEIDLESYLITNYHFTSTECSFAFSFAGGIYYALTVGGVWRCEKGKNLTIESNWEKTEDKVLKDVIVFSNNDSTHCWIIDDKKNIHILNPDGSHHKTSTRKCYEQLRSSGRFVFSRGWGFDIIDKESQEISYVQSAPYSSCRDFHAVDDSTLFAIHPKKGLIKLRIEFRPHDHVQIALLEETTSYFEIVGSQISKLAQNKDIIAGISGYKMYSKGYTDMYLTSANVNYYQNNQWTNVSEEDVKTQKLAGKEFRGLTDIVADRLNDKRFYVSTLTTGLYQFDSDSVTAHHFPKDRIASIYSDTDGTLWCTKDFNDSALWAYNHQTDIWTPHPISVFKQQPHISRILRQENEIHQLIWLMNGYPYNKGQICILYNEGDVNDQNKDQSCYISTLKDQDGNLYSFTNNIGYLYDIQEDKEGKIWILTDMGPFVVSDVVGAFNYAQNNPGIGLVTRVKVPRNDGTNLADYLLSSTTCSAMTTDQYNRKWIGTIGEGLYLISSDGLKEIEHFTTDNSPLHSNDITSLVYDDEEKRLFIACDGGIVIYHTDDSEPSKDFSSFHCYPNPLRPEYFGDVEVVGLMMNSQVSVTDSTGNLIWKTTCENGSVSWNAKDNNGDRVAPGVYLIHGISSSASEGKICKLLVL